MGWIWTWLAYAAWTAAAVSIAGAMAIGVAAVAAVVIGATPDEHEYDDGPAPGRE